VRLGDTLRSYRDTDGALEGEHLVPATDDHVISLVNATLQAIRRQRGLQAWCRAYRSEQVVILGMSRIMWERATLGLHEWKAGRASRRFTILMVEGNGELLWRRVVIIDSRIDASTRDAFVSGGLTANAQ
jgi:hypothetical protein